MNHTIEGMLIILIIMLTVPRRIGSYVPARAYRYLMPRLDTSNWVGGMLWRSCFATDIISALLSA